MSRKEVKNCSSFISNIRINLFDSLHPLFFSLSLMTPLRVFHTRRDFDAIRVFEKDFNRCLFSHDSWDGCCWCRSTLTVYLMLMLLLPIQVPESRQCNRWSETWRQWCIKRKKMCIKRNRNERIKDTSSLECNLNPGWPWAGHPRGIIIYSFTPFFFLRCVLCAWERLSLCKWLRSNSPCDFMITERWCEGGCEDETLVSVRGTEGKPEESEEDYFLSLPRQEEEEEELKTHSYTVCHSWTKASFQPKLHRE